MWHIGMSLLDEVSIHSRPKAAAPNPSGAVFRVPRFNSQPPEGGCVQGDFEHERTLSVSIHSRPKAAARKIRCASRQTQFQFTAARRRLPDLQ